MTWRQLSPSLCEDERLSASLPALVCLFILCVCECWLTCMYMYHMCQQRLGEGTGSPGDGVAGGRELQNMVTGNQTHISCKEQTML